MSTKCDNECKRVSARHILALNNGKNVYVCSISVQSLNMIHDFTLIKLATFLLNIQRYFYSGSSQHFYFPIAYFGMDASRLV